ncbi:MAG: hypothetical protein U1F25_18185 [Rubrivivax sp.]
MRSALMQVLASRPQLTHVTDGLRGRPHPRHFGRPAERVHAVRLEMCWSLYMEERAPAHSTRRAPPLAPVLQARCFPRAVEADA